MVLVRTWPFYQHFFLGKKDKDNVFYDIVERKNAFLGYKNNKLKKSKNGHFSNFFFQEIKARKISFTIFQNEKTPFQAIKTRSSKSRKIDFFPKGLTHDFGPNIAIFPTFFFQAIQARKKFFTVFQNEKTSFQANKTRSSKVEKLTFFQRG